jgi:hypothetical protein
MLVGGGLPPACLPTLSPSMVGGYLLFSCLSGEAPMSILISAHNAPLFREEREKLCGQEESMDG